MDEMEKLIMRASLMLAYVGEVEAADNLIQDGATPALAFFAVKAASVYLNHH